jgi:hypothetical protein
METWEKTIKERLFSKVKKHPNGCWVWSGATAAGYGKIGRKRPMSPISVHRMSYMIHFGKIKDGLFVLHKCDNKLCVNPDHLFLGTQKDNIRDMRNKNRGTKGENHPNSILTMKICRNIRKEYATGKTSLSILGRKYNICFQHVHDIVKNRIWREENE